MSFPKFIKIALTCIAAGCIITSLVTCKEKPLTIGSFSSTAVTIASVFPTGEVSVTANITIDFTHNMVPEDQVGIELQNDTITFTPEIIGKCRWVTPNKLRFHPKDPLAPATGYDAEVSPKLKSLKGLPLRGQRMFSFYTTPLKVKTAYGNGTFSKSTSSNLTTEWKVTFNQKVDPVQLKQHLRFSPDWNLRHNLKYTISPGTPDKEFTITCALPDKTRLKCKRIKVFISKQLRGINGPLGLKYDYKSWIGIAADLVVKQIKSQHLENLLYINIEFSAKVDPEIAKGYITIEPEIPFKVESYSRYLNLKGDFKAGKWYLVKIKSGLAANGGTRLEKDFVQNVKIGDLKPYINFQHDGVYLPVTNSQHIALESVNVDKINIKIAKIYKNNLVQFLRSSNRYNDWYSIGKTGKMVHTEEIEIDSVKNETVITPIDVGHFFDEGVRGIFQVTARSDKEYWVRKTNIAMITDIGIVASLADDDLFVWVNSLSTLAPIKNAEITLYSNNNQVIASGRTNNKGALLIKNLESLKEEEEYYPFLITASYRDDFSFMRFESCRLPLVSHDIGGRPLLAKGYEAFLFADRDIFRPNDKAHIAAVVRGVNVSNPESFPVKLNIIDPRNKSFDVILKTLDKSGMLDFEVIIPDYAMTGNYIASLLIADEEIGRMEFFVEDFIPDKSKVVIQTDKESYRTGETIKINVAGNYLFGPPAANQRVQCKLLVKSYPFSCLKFADYTFGDADRKFEEIEIELGDGILDENGKYTFEGEIPDNISPASTLKCTIAVTLNEEGGRAVSAYTDVTVHPWPFYIGLRPKSDDYAEIGKTYDINFVYVNPDCTDKEPEILEAKIYRVVYNTTRSRYGYGYSRYTSERSDELLHTIEIDPATTKTISFKPEKYGRYKILLGTPDGGTSSAIMFYASGWGYAPWSMENPGRIEIEVEKEIYKSGDKAKLLVKSPFPGKLLLLVQREKVFDYRIVNMPENTATITIPVRSEYLPNVYVSATVIKSLDEYDGESPMRAFGITPLMVNASGRKLGIEISSPEEIRPGKKLNLNVKVNNSKGVSHIAIAAVDEGILQLTGYPTPDPFEFFYGKKRLSAEYFDIFSFVFPELDKFKTQPAGDGYDEQRKKHLTPVGIKRVEPISLWSGIVKTDSKGNAKVSFDIPEFQGQLRIMAVAVNSSRVGNMEKDIFVRDKLILKPTLPRFISSLDDFILPVMVFNNTTKDGDFEVKLDIDGDVSILNNSAQSVQIADGESKAISYRLKVGNSIGKASFTISASGADETTKTTINVPIRPSSPVITKTGSAAITESEPLEIDLPGGFLESTQNAKLIISSFPQVQFTASLQYLLKYPHGCLEQTTSRVFPLLYFDEIARNAEPELFEKNSAWFFVEKGINKIITKQRYDGSFTYWSRGNRVCTWSSIYATHFLVEARIAGYHIPDGVYDDMLKYLKNYVKEPLDQDYLWQRQIYACYVLSIAGMPPKSSIDYFKENKLKSMPLSSQYQLAQCYIIAGDEKTAKKLLPDDIHPVTVERETGRNFRSSTRENAIMLNALHEISPEHPGIPILVKELSDSVNFGRWYTTQENAFALIAIGKVMKSQEDANYTGKIFVDREMHSEFNTDGLEIQGSEIVGKNVKISINGTGRCYLYWQAWGVPEKPVFDEYDKGIRVKRRYLDIDGNPLDYTAVKRGSLVVAEITMHALNKNLDNVIIDDMLPAGFEIENPRLQSRAQIGWVQKKKKDFYQDYMDIRDDRLLLYVSLQRYKPATFYYSLRAVTCGNFALPPISAECMYDPTYTSVQSSGTITVVD